MRIESAAEERTELYDYILNLSKEVEFIWHSPLQTTTVLYIVCRYFPFVDLIFDVATVEVGFGIRPMKDM
ncbi:hypothetical protein Clacol_007429 [Clathrus columnatus]|uniref:DUF6533 domain-containing protein n=1 Tax=Clathrus columnatus TaxID=1419009 RepID=A0AAV5AJ77_9AGAM|nr:hypothetical protein Clacol_007429 [Clathrus columnatus]